MSDFTTSAGATPAEIHFHTSSIYPAPPGYDTWKIRNDYPTQTPSQAAPRNGISGIGRFLSELVWGQQPSSVPDAPWLSVDARAQPELFTKIIKEYIFEGMTDNDFIPQKNNIRQWYHAPWMHYGPFGREPLHGLNFERPIPENELAEHQNRVIQTWSCAFYNATAASVLGKVWQDPNAPDWEQNLVFPQGSLIFKLIFHEATDEEVPGMKGSPTWMAMLAKDPSNPSDRNDTQPTPVRLLQVDFATSEKRAPIGWIFGSFMYDGRDFTPREETPTEQWNRVIPIGVQWGNSPDVTQENYQKGMRPKEQWMNPAAIELCKEFNGKRPSLGWNERMNGPADNFISACASCHTTAQKSPMDREARSIVPPMPVYDEKTKEWVPENDEETMKWFRNLPAGTPFDEDSASADYNMQLMIGYMNYVAWREEEKGGAQISSSLSFLQRTSRPLRAGPDIKYK